jgi:Fe-Mn family superoxide dismutase
MLRHSLRAVTRQFSAATSTSTRALTTATLPELTYDYAALAPHIAPEIMEIHHSKHHQTYVNNLNVVAEQMAAAEAAGDVTKQIALQQALKFNGGGHLNHSIFWTNLAPANAGGGGEPTGDLAAQITSRFGSFDEFKKQFNAASVGVQGSGWGWLGYNNATGSLDIATTANQDPLLTHTPLLGVDVWEHAYYLQYKNVRPDYMNAIWNVVNWSNVSERLSDAKN